MEAEQETSPQELAHFQVVSPVKVQLPPLMQKLLILC